MAELEERASWFRYIDESYGRSAVLAIAYSEVEVNTTITRALLGVSLAEIDRGWEKWASERYNATPDADRVAQAYRRWVPESVVCHPGVDY